MLCWVEALEGSEVLPLANEWGTGISNHFACCGFSPARISLARRARREGEGALEAFSSSASQPLRILRAAQPPASAQRRHVFVVGELRMRKEGT